MEEPTSKKVFPKYTAEQKAAFIEQWKQSGKSQRAFSIEKGLRFQSLNNWILAAKKRLRQFTPAQRATYVKQWRESGKTQRAFCEEHNLNHKSLSNWSMRMKPLLPAENTEQKAGKVKKAKKKRSGFVAIKIKKTESKSENIDRNVTINGGVFAKVKTPGGVVISLYKEVPAEYLRNIAQR
jgi:transposase-like protein